MGSACNTYACSHAHDRNRRRFRAILLRAATEKERAGRGERRQLREWGGALRVANGTLGSLGRARTAREKRVRKKMIGQDLRYKKKICPPRAGAPLRYPFPEGLRTHGDHGPRGLRGFLQLAPSRITDEKDSGVHSSSLDE